MNARQNRRSKARAAKRLAAWFEHRAAYRAEVAIAGRKESERLAQLHVQNLARRMADNEERRKMIALMEGPVLTPGLTREYYERRATADIYVDLKTMSDEMRKTGHYGARWAVRDNDGFADRGRYEEMPMGEAMFIANEVLTKRSQCSAGRVV